ncbi:hypothetical protein, partial [Klebsiella grimontii]|uniref:hypothetical protein n=1 Tax=Klebsiella grimontii TaxID=2058152 RepID=UPI001F151DAC
QKNAPGGAYAPLDAFIPGHTRRHWRAAQTFYSLILSNAKLMPVLPKAISRALAHYPGAFKAKNAPSAGNKCPLIVHLLLWGYAP